MATKKVEICHIPPGNPSNAHTIVVGQPAVKAHLAHGDTLGPCQTPISRVRQLTEATLSPQRSIVKVEFRSASRSCPSWAYSATGTSPFDRITAYKIPTVALLSAVVGAWNQWKVFSFYERKTFRHPSKGVRAESGRMFTPTESQLIAWGVDPGSYYVPEDVWATYMALVRVPGGVPFLGSTQRNSGWRTLWSNQFDPEHKEHGETIWNYPTTLQVTEAQQASWPSDVAGPWTVVPGTAMRHASPCEQMQVRIAAQARFPNFVYPPQLPFLNDMRNWVLMIRRKPYIRANPDSLTNSEYMIPEPSPFLDFMRDNYNSTTVAGLHGVASLGFVHKKILKIIPELIPKKWIPSEIRDPLEKAYQELSELQKDTIHFANQTSDIWGPLVPGGENWAMLASLADQALNGDHLAAEALAREGYTPTTIANKLERMNLQVKVADPNKRTSGALFLVGGIAVLGTGLALWQSKRR